MQTPKAKRTRSSLEPPAAAAASKIPPHSGAAGHISEFVNTPAATMTAAPGEAASPVPAGHAAAAAAAGAVLGLVSSGAYEAQAQALMGDLQHALGGLGELQFDLTPLQALVSSPAGWTGDTELKSKARELVAAAALQHPVSGGSAARSISEIQRDLEDTHSLLSVGGLADHRRARLQSEADGFIAELHNRQEGEQQAAAFASGQALRIQEVRQMLKTEIEVHEEAVELAAGLRRVMEIGRRFL